MERIIKVPWARGRVNGELIVSDFLFWIMKKFWNQIGMMVAQYWECD